ncbi:hypothetical protein [Castellaniella sp.]|uniref:hypothetical protein n=1 Tax=Castellaniella sp. TaxID=1955812 RepID=UPI002AFFCDF8|nr:hypothetical protein [Castellaniella sp.]
MDNKMRDFITGMSVSVDVSTGDDDVGNRYFGTVTEVMDYDGDKHGVTLLVQDAEPNFDAPCDATKMVPSDDDSEDQWRRLALQFDGHRMQAIGWLKAAQAGLPNTPTRAGICAFLAAPPLSGEQVLADRIAAMSQPAASAEPTDEMAATLLNELGGSVNYSSAKRAIKAVMRCVAPVAQEPTESAVLLDALSGLVNVLRERHYGRMPDEVQAAYDKAWAIVFSSPVAAPVAQKPMVDMLPPATSRDRWMYQQGRLAERDPRTPGSFAAEIPAQAQPTMPPLTEAMRAVLRNEHCVYDSEDALYAALCNAAGSTPSAQDREDDEALADTQRAIIEAAEQRGYERAIAECTQDREDARVAFTNWCDRNEFDRAQRLDGTGYNNPATARAWAAWQAASVAKEK